MTRCENEHCRRPVPQGMLVRAFGEWLCASCVLAELAGRLRGGVIQAAG